MSDRTKTRDDSEPDREESLDDFIERETASGTDLRDAISFLIHHRELLRDCEIEQLEAKAEELVKALASTKRKILLEELDCFKDVLRMHRRLLENDDPSN